MRVLCTPPIPAKSEHYLDYKPSLLVTRDCPLASIRNFSTIITLRFFIYFFALSLLFSLCFLLFPVLLCFLPRCRQLSIDEATTNRDVASKISQNRYIQSVEFIEQHTNTVILCEIVGLSPLDMDLRA